MRLTPRTELLQKAGRIVERCQHLDSGHQCTNNITIDISLFEGIAYIRINSEINDYSVVLEEDQVDRIIAQLQKLKEIFREEAAK